MPEQVTGVQVIPRQDNPLLYDLQIGPNGWESLDVSELFGGAPFTVQQMLDNIRLRRIIGNYGPVWSDEFLGALNATGVHCSNVTFYSCEFTENVDGSYTVGFTSAQGQPPNETITVDAAWLSDDLRDLQTVRRNVGAFLRLAGYTDLTTPAPNGLYAGMTGPQAVATWTFRY